MSTDWTDEDFLGYCDIHCETPRALFSREHIERLAKLAGGEWVWRNPHAVPTFYALHAAEAKPLIKKARERLRD